jgi:hypothetical protein
MSSRIRLGGNRMQQSRLRWGVLSAHIAVAALGCWIVSIGYFAGILLVMLAVLTIPISLLFTSGEPFVWSLSFNATPESIAFRKELKSRPVLSDEEFFQRFACPLGIPPSISAGVRRSLRAFDPIADRMLPSENIGLIEDEWDFEMLLHEVGDEFGVRFGPHDYPAFDGTLDNLMRQTFAKVGAKNQSQ